MSQSPEDPTPLDPAQESTPTPEGRRQSEPEPQAGSRPARPAGAATVWVNGDAHPLPPAGTVAALVAQLGLSGRKIAVAVDRAVVPRSRLAEHPLVGGERIEILEAVGGG